jgi:hypothetical protein
MDGLEFGRVPPLIRENDRPTACGPSGATSIIVNGNPLLDIRSVADVERAVGAAENIDEKGIC